MELTSTDLENRIQKVQGDLFTARDHLKHAQSKADEEIYRGEVQAFQRVLDKLLAQGNPARRPQ